LWIRNVLPFIMRKYEEDKQTLKKCNLY
jgi:hypothetical protein